jgi:hypothetical protein
MPAVVTDLGTAFARTGPISAGMIVGVCWEIGHAVGQRPGHDLMLVWIIPDPVNPVASFINRSSFDKIRVEVQLIQIACNQFTICIVPQT